MRSRRLRASAVALASSLTLLAAVSSVAEDAAHVHGKPGAQVTPEIARLLSRVRTSPCASSLSYLIIEYFTNPAVPDALSKVARGLTALPPGYDSGHSGENPWRSGNARELLDKMLNHFSEWCTFLPRIEAGQDNGLAYFLEFVWFYYRNEAGVDFVQGRHPRNVGLQFMRDFTVQRGAYLNSPASRAHLQEWIKDPRIEIEDYQRGQASDYPSWNAFFARRLKVDAEREVIPSRPATMPMSTYPERDYIVVSPTDCIMNPLVQVITDGAHGASERKYIENPLQKGTVLDIKRVPITVGELLRGVDEDIAARFVGGTGLSCVLMPNTYHHFHAPVNGTVMHAKLVPDGTYGYSDFANWVPLDRNVGRPGTDFSQFQAFQRAVIVIEVRYASAVPVRRSVGYVAMVPVGLGTVGSVVLDDRLVPGSAVKRGYTRLGNFYYGGSLIVILFSKGLTTSAVQTRLGNQIAVLNMGRADPPERQAAAQGRSAGATGTGDR